MASTISTRKDKPLKGIGVSSTIENFKYIVGDILADLLSLDIFAIRDFNAMNHAIMEFQMYRNPAEKERILQYSGANAYYNGDSENYSQAPYVPSYAGMHNYLQFSDNIGGNERGGVLATYESQDGKIPDSYKDNVFNRMHYYWDLEDGEEANEDNQHEPSIGVFEGSDSASRNSILYKTRKLFREGKIKSIVSQFHTDKTVTYNGQVGTKGFGESHGRNLLRKSPEMTNFTNYAPNGFDNPYCRVWTHHYQYDRLYKTMRGEKKGINYWGDEFEWTEEEKKRLFPTFAGQKDESDNENYAYAWRGEHNQRRREKYSVLDTYTGLLKIAPKHIFGGATNVHTKDCMFSIENLAWKDYDPYSFTQALSWEQRGPLGGRIMWFPPYGITFTETATANWNSSDFIGRGEKVYTYINSERSGNLSFYMVTDHPSSIDYSSWYENNEDKENDYHRYFAGCMEGSTSPTEGTEAPSDNDKVWTVDNIHERPTYLTDEWINGDVPPITSPGENKVFPPPPSAPQMNEDDDKNPTKVEFFVFFPNNYSGVNDAPVNQDSPVNAISYLLCGRNAQKYTKDKDTYWDLYIDDKCQGSDNRIFPGSGYELSMGGITMSNCIDDHEYIIGGYYSKIPDYVPEDSKKWCYRIDHVLDSDGDYIGKDTPNNTICQKLVGGTQNMKDMNCYGYNRNVSSNTDVQSLASSENKLYSFLEFACAFHKVVGNKDTYDYIYNNVISGGAGDNDSRTRIDELVDIFQDRKLKEVLCEGMSSSHGDGKGVRNTALAENRAKTVMAWLRTNPSWSSVENTSDSGIAEVGGYVPNENINSKDAKLYRCAHCVLTFSSSDTKSETDTDPIADHVGDNDYYEHVDFWESGKEYSFGDYVQYRGKLYEYNAMDVFNDDDSVIEVPLSPESSPSFEDISKTVQMWDESKSYSTGDIVLYEGVYYKVKQEVKGVSASGTSDYKEFPNFVELTDEEVRVYQASGIIKTIGNRKYYKRKDGVAYNQVSDGGTDMEMERLRNNIENCGDIWFRSGEEDSLHLLCEVDALANDYDIYGNEMAEPSGLPNKLRYDQEYYFYKRYFSDHPFVFQKLQDKIRYFNPVFHSMTPEGFNARLTFLHQCTRQGMTKTMGDVGGKTANNLAFGRPPYCVLRLGDFYNQMIVIENVTFDYSVSDGITWDLNTEGNGVQPMLCKVNISFKFIGGGDITGPVQRLQNAMSFNYYANTSFYDNRADRVEYEKTDYKTMGGAEHNNVDLDRSYAFTPKVLDDRPFDTRVN